MNAASSRSGPSVGVALAIGVPLGALILAAFHFSPVKDTPAFRYVEHPTQWALVLFFCVGLGALAHKLFLWWGERAALDTGVLPHWDGKPQPVSQAGDLLTSVERHRASGSWLGQRAAALLRFVSQRGSAEQVDDQLRTLADNDEVANDSSYSFLRFITWAIPILGFLGTVIGITAAIGNVSPDRLENDMGAFTGGLAEAFDATALALGLTMVLMFATSLVERMEQSLLSEITSLAEERLAHRFAQAGGPEDASLVSAIQEQTAQLLAAQGGPVAQMVEMLQMRMMATMQQAMGESLTQFAQQTGAIVQQMTALASAIREAGQQQQQALLRVAEGVATQAAVLGKLQEGEANLVHLQAVLHQNLAALASASNFEQAVHSLTAAVHLLTARGGGGNGAAPRLSIHGAAA